MNINLEVEMINILNTKKLEKDFVINHKEKILNVLIHIEEVPNLLFIYACLLSIKEDKMANYVSDRISLLFDYSYYYHNYDLVYIYAKKSGLDLNQTFENQRDRTICYDIYFNEEDCQSNLFFDLSVLNLSNNDVLDYFKYRRTSSTSMESERGNQAIMAGVLNMNSLSFDELINNPVLNSDFYPSDSLKLGFKETSFTLTVNSNIEEHQYNPYTNRLSTEENFQYIEKIMGRNHYYYDFLIFYVLDNIVDFSELANYPKIKNQIFKIYSKELQEFQQQQYFIEIAFSHQLTVNTDSFKFKNIVIINKFINDYFIKEFLEHIKTLPNSKLKQEMFIALEHLGIDSVKIEDYFDEGYLSNYPFHMMYGDVYYSDNPDYSILRYNDFFRDLYSDYVIRGKKSDIVLKYYIQLGISCLKKYCKTHEDFREEFKDRFFEYLYDEAQYTNEEYNRNLLRFVFKDKWGYDDDITMIDNSKDIEGFIELLNPSQKAIYYYIKNDNRLIEHFDQHKDLLLTNEKFVRLLTNGKFEGFIKDLVNKHQSTSIVVEINKIAEDFGLDTCDFQTNYSTTLITDVEDIF